MNTKLTGKRAAIGLAVILFVLVLVLASTNPTGGHDQSYGRTEANESGTVSGAGHASVSLPTVGIAAESGVVKIDPPSAVTEVVAEPLTPAADVDLEEPKKKTGRVKITQDTLDRITGGAESLVAVPLFDGEVIQVQLEERQPLGSSGM